MKNLLRGAALMLCMTVVAFVGYYVYSQNNSNNLDIVLVANIEALTVDESNPNEGPGKDICWNKEKSDGEWGKLCNERPSYLRPDSGPSIEKCGSFTTVKKNNSGYICYYNR